MPVEMKTITSTKKGTLGQKVEIRDYWFSSDMEPIGVAYGCFSPFTGKYGHARLLETGATYGIRKFIILSPNKKQPIDDDRNMFTLEQKVMIAKEGAKELGYKIIDATIASSNFIVSNLLELAEKYPENRLVILCGPDRIEEYSKYAIPFEKDNEQFPSDDESVRGKFELIGVDSRGEKQVSGTKVREAIRNQVEEAFIEMTGYTDKMWKMINKFLRQNGLLKEALEATNRVRIKHLYNPGNPQELSPLEFMGLVELIDDDNGKLVNGKNFSLTEKSDGTAFRMGIDDEEKFFIEQSYSGPIYDTSFFKNKYEQKFGKVNRLARGWMNLLTDLQQSNKIQSGLKKIFEKIGPFKISGEAYINELGLKDDKGHIRFVGSNYDIEKIGKKDTIIMFSIADSEGHTVSNSEKLINYLIKNCSTNDIKLDNAETNSKINLNLSKPIQTIKNELFEIEEICQNNFGKSVTEILTNKSRLKQDLIIKKKVKEDIEELQGILNSAIEKHLEKYEGKWGPDYEGVVLKMKNGSMIKITSKSFKNFKASHDTSLQDYIMGENFIEESYRYLKGVISKWKRNLKRG